MEKYVLVPIDLVNRIECNMWYAIAYRSQDTYFNKELKFQTFIDDI